MNQFGQPRMVGRKDAIPTQPANAWNGARGDAWARGQALGLIAFQES
jgi:hypothetical protein